MKKTFMYILFLLFFLTEMDASEWNSFIINYSKGKYGNGSQTWQISVYNKNWVYFANQNGMLQFDGDSWKVFKMHNLSDVRSVYASQRRKRIFVGGINEFGYYEPGKDGRLTYVCMSDSLAGDTRYIGNVWGIHENDNILYFQGDHSVLKYLNGKYTVIEMNAKIDCSDMVNGVLYLGTSKGVWVLIGNSFFPLNGAKSLISTRIRSILPYKDGVMIVTAYDGLYYCDGQKIISFPVGIEDFMRKNEVFCAAISGNKMALGTIRKGGAVIDLQTKRIKYFNENNGLQDQTVLSVCFDPLGNLWTGLDQGIDYVCLNNPFSTLYTYPNSLGTGYTALVDGDVLYLGTNRGLYATSYPVKLDENLSVFKQVTHSSGQVWNLSRIGNDIFCSHDRGLFLLKNKILKRIGAIQGVWTCQQVMGHNDMAYLGTYDGIFLMKKDKGNWKILTQVSGMHDSCRKFEQESADVLWVIDSNYIGRIWLSKDLTKIVRLQKFDVGQGLPIGRYGVCKIEGEVYFLTKEGIYQYNKATRKMESAKKINILLGGESKYNVLLEYENLLIGLNHDEVCASSLHLYKESERANIIPVEVPAIELVNNAEELIPISKYQMIIPNDNGFALLNIPPENKRKRHARFMYIRNVYLTDPNDSLIYCNNFISKREQPKIAYRWNSIRFNFSCSSLTHGENVKYQYRMKGKQWSDLTTLNYKEYSGLSEGYYRFDVRAVFQDGTTAADSYDFIILSPWYRTSMAYVCYLLIILMIVWLAYRWDDRRVKQKEHLAVKKKDEQMHRLEKEYEEEKVRKEQQIMNLEKERLEYEVKHKSQEIANMMINLARRNELLIEIKTDLLQVVNAVKGDRAKEYKQMLLIVNNKIDSNIQSDDVLKKVEEQFDLIHNNFMKRLRVKYPDLSNNERMMCAYLKMNLSTKEIAPLLNISVRGVETLRYRLRKKFNLDRDDNLNSFLDEGI
ncbi:MAG: transcriptional regulator [Bacteroidaceae bacterium]